MFCQSHADDKLHQVITFRTNHAVHDLIVAEGEYHLRCYLKSKKQCAKVNGTITLYRFANAMSCSITEREYSQRVRA